MVTVNIYSQDGKMTHLHHWCSNECADRCWVGSTELECWLHDKALIMTTGQVTTLHANTNEEAVNDIISKCVWFEFTHYGAFSCDTNLSLSTSAPRLCFKWSVAIKKQKTTWLMWYTCCNMLGCCGKRPGCWVACCWRKNCCCMFGATYTGWYTKFTMPHY